MGFGVSNILNKYIHKALISWDDHEYIENGFYGLVEKGNIQVDVKISETHKFSNNVTEQTMEDGSIVAEHVISNPIDLTIQFEETNNTVLNQMSPLLEEVGISKFGPAGTFEKLEKLWRYKVPLTITTQHKQYTNMQIAHMPIMHRAPYKNSIQVVIDLRQMNFSTIETTAYRSKNAGTQKSAMDTVKSGLQSLIPF